MSQCVQSLRNVLEEKIHRLKKEKYFSNSDWSYLEKNFHIDNPYLSTLIDDEQNNHQCSKCHRQWIKDLNEVQYEDLLEEIRIRIINIQKVKFEENQSMSIEAVLEKFLETISRL